MRRRLTNLLTLTAMMLLLAGSATLTQTHAMGMTNGNATVATQHLTDGFGGMGMQLATTGTTYSEGQQVAIYANDGVATTKNLAMTGSYDQNGFLQLASGPPNTFDAAALVSANLANNVYDPMTTFTLASSTSPPHSTLTATFVGTMTEKQALVNGTMAKTNGEVAYVMKCPLLGTNFVTWTPASYSVLRT